MEFHDDPSSGSRVVPYGRTDMLNITVAFRNIANMSKNGRETSEYLYVTGVTVYILGLAKVVT